MANSPQLIDMNTHLSFLSEEVMAAHLKTANDRGVQFVLSGYDESDFRRQLRINIDGQGFKGFGYHPWAAAKLTDVNSCYLNALESPQVEAFSLIGEIGLDFSNEVLKSKAKMQKAIFRKSLALARDIGKPIQLHVVGAHGVAIQMLNEFNGLRGFVHGFSGAPEVALEYIRLGLKISIGPDCLNPKFKKLKATLETSEVVSHLVFETDQPETGSDQSSYDPGLLSRVIAQVAQVSGRSRQELVDRAREHFLNMIS